MTDAIVQVDPLPVYFTFSRIRSQFSCGRRVHDTLQALLDGALSPADLPTIALLFYGVNYFSLNNRRLFVFKELARRGLVSTVPARVRPVPQTKRMRDKYSVDKCALEARCHQRQGRDDDNGGSDVGGNDDGVEVEGEHRVAPHASTAPAAARDGPPPAASPAVVDAAAASASAPSAPQQGGHGDRRSASGAGGDARVVGPAVSQRDRRQQQQALAPLAAGDNDDGSDDDDAFLSKKERTRKKKKAK